LEVVPMANFIPVPAHDIESLLQSKGFARGKQGNEVVYTKHSSVDPYLHVKVYTSIREGQTQVRAAGRDAIRVCAVWDNKVGRNFGVGRFQPVFRVQSVQSVLERLELRLREAAQRCKDWLAEQAARNPPPPPPPPEAYSSEPPEAGEVSFEQYAATLEVPF
jgi:hypothetical protein